MEVYQMTLSGQKHTIPWHVIKAAEKDSYNWDEGVLVFLNEGHGDWMACPARDANRPEHTSAKAKFYIRDGKMLDADGKRIRGVRS